MRFIRPSASAYHNSNSSSSYSRKFRHFLATSTLVLAATPTQCFSSVATTTTNSKMMMMDNKVNVPSDNIKAIEGLEPKSLWNHFATLSSIPRQSKKEQAIIQYIKDFTNGKDFLTWKQDSVGNLVVFHPGCGKFGQQAPPVLLQGHVDMVTEKNTATKHNFDTDPIRFRKFLNNDDDDDDDDKQQEEWWLGAQGTTLGADNGIGVAAALSLLEISPTTNTENYEFPPLQALFTVDEETGLTGAFDLDANELGLTATTMLNLDTEEWGELYVGCAGGGESTLKLPLQRRVSTTSSTTSSSNNNNKLVELRVEGLLGGHSGINIHEGRANAVLLCAATVQVAMEEVKGVQLVSMSGGDKHNAIPREARAMLMLSGGGGGGGGKEEEDTRAKLEQVIQRCQVSAQAEYGLLENKLRIDLVEPEQEQEGKKDDDEFCIMPLEKDSANRLLSMLLALPHGPIKFSHAMPDLVETSNNVASLVMDDTEATVLCSTRSSIGSALDGTRNRLTAIASLAGASIEKSAQYPGWNPNMKSPILDMAKTLLSERLLSSAEEKNNEKAKTVGVKAIHAGLECGLLIEKMGGNVDALSFGPTIEGAHSPDERIKIDTVPPFFELVKDILSELAKKQA